MRRLGALFLSFAAAAHAQTRVLASEILENSRQVLTEIYNLDYDRAEELCRRLSAARPDHPAGQVLLARTEWARQLTEERALSIERFASSGFFSGARRTRDRAAAGRFRQISAEAVRKAKARIDRNPQDLEARFFLGLAYQHMASYDFSLNRDWWSAFQNGSKTLKYHRELLRADPGFIDPRLSTAVEYYVASAVPWYTKWLSVMLGYRGDKERGKRELEQVARKGLLLADDARTILALLYSLDRQHDRALGQLTELQRRYPRNYVVELERGGTLLRLRRPADAIDAYRAILDKVENARDGFERLERASVFNRLGVACRMKGDLAAAVDWLERSLADPQHTHRSGTIARLELGKTLDLLGRREEALRHYREVLAADDVAGSRKEAQERISRGFTAELPR